MLCSGHIPIIALSFLIPRDKSYRIVFVVVVLGVEPTDIAHAIQLRNTPKPYFFFSIERQMDA